MPIWYNTRVCSYFNKDWFNKGIKFVKDLFIEDQFITIEYLQDTLEVKCNFLDYAHIKSKIMKLRLNLNINKVQPILPYILKIIQMNGKGCQPIYSIIQPKATNIIPNLREKWEIMLKMMIFLKMISIMLLKLHKNYLSVYITDMYNSKYCMIG